MSDNQDTQSDLLVENAQLREYARSLEQQLAGGDEFMAQFHANQRQADARFAAIDRELHPQAPQRDEAAEERARAWREFQWRRHFQGRI